MRSPEVDIVGHRLAAIVRHLRQSNEDLYSLVNSTTARSPSRVAKTGGGYDVVHHLRCRHADALNDKHRNRI
jgi:hypothetical protein